MCVYSVIHLWLSICLCIALHCYMLVFINSKLLICHKCRIYFLLYFSSLFRFYILDKQESSTMKNDTIERAHHKWDNVAKLMQKRLYTHMFSLTLFVWYSLVKTYIPSWLLCIIVVSIDLYIQEALVYCTLVISFPQFLCSYSYSTQTLLFNWWM